jgi:hypothetical protein
MRLGMYNTIHSSSLKISGAGTNQREYFMLNCHVFLTSGISKSLDLLLIYIFLQYFLWSICSPFPSSPAPMFRDVISMYCNNMTSFCHDCQHQRHVLSFSIFMACCILMKKLPVNL